MGPVSFYAAALLLFAAPLMRGGNRHIALIVLEALALVVLASMLAQPAARARLSWPRRIDSLSQWLLVFSPAVLALVYLVPVPLSVWSALPGRETYVRALGEAGVAMPATLALSLVPEATAASLLAGLPLAAAFLVGRACTLHQLKLLARIVVAVALAQVVLGLLQIAGGPSSPLHFGAASARPIGTFANSNHYANYLAAALVLYIWRAFAWRSAHPFAPPAAMMAWIAGGVFLVLGIVLSRSRGAALTGLAAAVIAFAWLAAARAEGPGRKRAIALMLAAVAAGVAAIVGVDFLLSRLSPAELSESASFRASLTRSTLHGAATFWPLGAGWGTFPAVYPRFQPADIPGFAGHAHQDYAEMLFDGGAFAIVLAASFAWLAVARLRCLLSPAGGGERDRRAAALCGLGLLGFLLHSLVDFNMHIPANAILASLMAGVYLRPLLID